MSANYLIISTLMVLSGFLVYRIQRFVRLHRTWELAGAFTVFAIGGIVMIQNPALAANFKFGFYSALFLFLSVLAFEPEIAGFLNQIAERLNPVSQTQKKTALSEIAQAAAALAATKTGALIAFERSDSLLKFGETGIEINADIKKELVTTLFFKDTATHDGGLLIREGRATHCGAVFPLSERKQIENGLGTRHRAALGLSERTDAVCLIVSEEEGTISLTRDGELFYAVPTQQVEAKLAKLLSGTSRFRFYPFHYIKHLSPKLVQANYIQFRKSLTEKIYELSAVLFFAVFFSLLASDGTIRLAELQTPKALLLGTPWMLIPAALLALNGIIFLSNRIVYVNGVINEIKIEHRFLFFPLFRKTILKESLRGVTLKHEKTGTNLWSLELFNKKKRKYLLDRSSSQRSLSDYAKKIREILRIDLVS